MSKIITIILAVITILFLIIDGYFVYTYLSSKKLVCESDTVGLTIMYNDKELTNYITRGNIGFDFKSQNSYVEKIGIEEYIKSIDSWFHETTGGECKKK